jgi:aminoglycoside 6'-N-acetyltransferase
MYHWFNTPHVSEWWSFDGNHHPSLQEVKSKYSPRVLGKENVECYIFSCDGKPIGMIQSSCLDKEPAEKAVFGVGDNCTGIDLLIGDAEYLHKGLGSKIVRQFLKEKVFSDKKTASCVADPYVKNKISIRCCQKAGFHYLRTIWYEPEKKREDIYIIYRDEIN